MLNYSPFQMLLSVGYIHHRVKEMSTSVRSGISAENNMFTGCKCILTTEMCKLELWLLACSLLLHIELMIYSTESVIFYHLKNKGL